MTTQRKTPSPLGEGIFTGATTLAQPGLSRTVGARWQACPAPAASLHLSSPSLAMPQAWSGPRQTAPASALHARLLAGLAAGALPDEPQGADQPQERRIDLFLAGCQKGGTTSLHAYLRRHPALSAPARKELHIFDDENRDWDSPDYSDLNQWYAAGDEGRLRYDATPIYSYWRPSLERIRRYNPQARLVFLFRDPFARAWSQWCMEYARGDETMPFAQALREGRQRMRIWPPLSTAERTYSYIERSFYGQQVVRALRLFPRSQLLFLKSEDLARDHMGTLQRIADFLQVEPFAPMPYLRENARPQVHYPAWPTQEDRDLAMRMLQRDTELFAALTGLSTSDWTGEIEPEHWREAAE